MNFNSHLACPSMNGLCIFINDRLGFFFIELSIYWNYNIVYIILLWPRIGCQQMSKTEKNMVAVLKDLIKWKRKIGKWKWYSAPDQERGNNLMIKISAGGKRHLKAVYIWGETSVIGEKLILHSQVNLEETHQVVNVPLSSYQKSWLCCSNYGRAEPVI